jgi:hypothetical protein
VTTLPAGAAEPPRPSPWWQQGGAEGALALLCAWTWLAPFGPQPLLFQLVCYALLLELITIGPSLLVAGLRRRGSAGSALVGTLLLALIPAAALWMFNLGTGQGVFGALLAIALLLWRMLGLGVLQPAADPRAFLLIGLLGVLVLFSLIIGTYGRELPAFGQAWPSPRALGFPSDDPEPWVASPPRVLFTGLVYYGLLASLRLLVARWPGALRRRH